MASATALRMLSGEIIKLDKLAPGMVKALACAEARKAADMLAMVKEQQDGSCWIGPVFWDGLKKLLGECRPRKGCNQEKRACLRALISHTHWPQERLHRHGLARGNLCQKCKAAPGSLWHRS